MPSDTRKKHKGQHEIRKRDEKELNKIADGNVEGSVLTSPKRILIQLAEVDAWDDKFLPIKN